MLFLACTSVRNSFLKFLISVLGTQIWPPSEKSRQFFATWLQDLDFFQGLEIERRPPQQFSTIFWDVLDPPSHSEHQKKYLVRLQNFSKMAPEVPIFRCRESRIRDSESRIRDSKSSGISWVKTLFFTEVFLGLKTSPRVSKKRPKFWYF